MNGDSVIDVWLEASDVNGGGSMTETTGTEPSVWPWESIEADPNAVSSAEVLRERAEGRLPSAAPSPSWTDRLWRTVGDVVDAIGSATASAGRLIYNPRTGYPQPRTAIGTASRAATASRSTGFMLSPAWALIIGLGLVLLVLMMGRRA